MKLKMKSRSNIALALLFLVCMGELANVAQASSSCKIQEQQIDFGQIKNCVNGYPTKFADIIEKMSAWHASMESTTVDYLKVKEVELREISEELIKNIAEIKLYEEKQSVHVRNIIKNSFHTFAMSCHGTKIEKTQKIVNGVYSSVMTQILMQEKIIKQQITTTRTMILEIERKMKILFQNIMKCAGTHRDISWKIKEAKEKYFNTLKEEKLMNARIKKVEDKIIEVQTEWYTRMLTESEHFIQWLLRMQHEEIKCGGGMGHLAAGGSITQSHLKTNWDAVNLQPKEGSFATLDLKGEDLNKIMAQCLPPAPPQPTEIITTGWSSTFLSGNGSIVSNGSMSMFSSNSTQQAGSFSSNWRGGSYTRFGQSYSRSSS